MAWMVSDRAVRVVCDDCASPAQRSGKAVRWPSRTRAVAELFSRRWGWLATREIQLCPHCLARRVCQARGHSWQPADRGGPRHALGTECCGRCTTPRSVLTPAAGPARPDLHVPWPTPTNDPDD